MDEQYHAENREVINGKKCLKKLNCRWIVRCAHGGKVKKNTWARYVKTEKHRKRVGGGGGDEKVGRDMVGVKGWAELSSKDIQ